LKQTLPHKLEKGGLYELTFLPLPTRGRSILGLPLSRTLLSIIFDSAIGILAQGLGRREGSKSGRGQGCRSENGGGGGGPSELKR